MSGALLLSVWLAASAQGATPAPALSGKALFEARMTAWKDSRKAVQEILDRLRVSLRDRPLALQSVDQLVTRWRQNQGLQRALHKKLVENQGDALADGVINQERHDLHVAKLNRLLEERMLILWGHDAPFELNAALKAESAVTPLKGYPFPVYPKREDWEKFQMKDFVPVYDKAEKQMKTQQE